jgi:hypothetical protein
MFAFYSFTCVFLCLLERADVVQLFLRTKIRVVSISYLIGTKFVTLCVKIEMCVFTSLFSSVCILLWCGNLV